MTNQQNTYEEMARSLGRALQNMLDETPCPFCGGSVELDGMAGGVRVGCKKCDAWGEVANTAVPAYESWVKYVRLGEEWEKKRRKPEEVIQMERCPFCSAEHVGVQDFSVIRDGKLDSKVRVGCSECGSWGPMTSSRNEAWKDWTLYVRQRKAWEMESKK